ncbi:inorganic phosphate transporter [Nitratireductor mangrovi]|uniref:Phosphate transporter n=1 Tax=Nitratireductor mangrovi TaxID=2599600 RepID=A0A5B8KVG9_9HYPH|nr:inorganic phosphate transporter [Nitratireductor mangrovi]QDY99656.1 inorganic phosphate transporter [Nitratireductor mangrovi]
MSNTGEIARKTTLDKDLAKLSQIEEATSFLARGLVAPGLALFFLALVAVAVAVFTAGDPGAIAIVAAAAIGAYMALNIGANDVANNVAPAVGSRALTMGGALIMAAFFETAGALIAGGDVVDTISKGIIDPDSVAAPGVFVSAMMAALLASAVWVNLATAIGAPVSTTHSVVGGVMGAGIASAGFAAVNWPVMSGIAASWVISPFLGGIIAALFLAFVKSRIIYQDDKIAAARRWVPLLIGIMAGAFAAYLATKGLKKIVHLPGMQIAAIGVGAFLLAWGVSHVHVARQSASMENRNQSLRKLFGLPLVISAALLSFAHGANDVANAVGPLAAIVQTATHGELAAVVAIPFWVMLIGAVGISLGLLLFGPKLVRMVGEQITKLNPMRAFCVALSAALTVIVASWFGLPVSSTHIAVGAVFGVGFFREWYTANSPRRRAYLERKAVRLRNERKQSNGEPAGTTADMDDDEEEDALPSAAREEARRRKLVRRAHFSTIVAAWVVTVPSTALIAALIFHALNLLS